MKSGILKGSSKKKIYQSDINFEHECFSNTFGKSWKLQNVIHIVNLKKTFTNVLNVHAHIETKMIILSAFMTKESRKQNYEKTKTKKQV